MRIATALGFYASARVWDAYTASADEVCEGWLRARVLFAGGKHAGLPSAPSPKVASNTFRKARMDPRSLLAEIDARMALADAREFPGFDKHDGATIDVVYDLAAIRQAAPGLWNALEEAAREPSSILGGQDRRTLLENPSYVVFLIFKFTGGGAGSTFEPNGTRPGTVRANARTHEALRIWRQAWIDAPRELRTAFTPK